jgi:pimeloyl-ACP methyl ester carboxylesterase
MAKVMPPSRTTNAHARVEDSSKILKRFYVAERQLMRTLAGWFVGTSQWDLKRQLAQDLWQTVQHADALRARILELRYPRRDVDRKYDPQVLAYMAELAKARHPLEFIAGAYDVFLPEIVIGYSAYLQRSDGLDDAPTVYILGHILQDKQMQIERMLSIRQELGTAQPEQVAA